MGELYAPDILRLAKNPETDNIAFDRKVFDDVVAWLHREGHFSADMLADPHARRLIEATYDVLNGAIGASVKQEVPAELTAALRNNAFIFSGFKTYNTLSELGLELTDDKGAVKPFAKFIEDVHKIDERYNGAYLFAEYNHAIHSSQMAVKWHDIAKDGDEYNLQYRTAGDDRVREAHARLDGVTLPPSDKFWDHYLPPNGWNCRCQVVQVLREDYAVSDSDTATKWGDECTKEPKQQIFRFNAGKELKLFPPKHPYYKVPQKAKTVVEQIAVRANPATPQFTAKTIEEATQQFVDKLGVKCALNGFKKKDLAQVKDIFDCVALHFTNYPELRQKIQFVGSVSGRVKMLEEAKFQELRAKNPQMWEEAIRKYARSFARKYAAAGSNTYAYSHAAFSEYGLNGVAFNSAWAGDKVKNALLRDVEHRFHPIGCDTVKSIFDHELGHKLDELLSLYTDPDFLAIYNPAKAQGEQYITDNLSHYAYNSRMFRKSNYTPQKEFIAEAWSEYLNNEKPRPIAVAVGELIKRKYNAKK